MTDAAANTTGSKDKQGHSKWTNLTAILGFLTALMVLISTALGIFAARSNRAADEATDRASDLSSEVDVLQQTVDGFEQANEELAAQNTALEEENAQLRDQLGIQANGPQELVIEDVRIEAGDFKRVAPWQYELDGSGTLDFRFWWTTIANTGQLEGTDCVVVATIEDLSDGSTFDVHRTQTCSLTGWVREELPAGNYGITVEVQAVTGATGVGNATVQVLP